MQGIDFREVVSDVDVIFQFKVADGLPLEIRINVRQRWGGGGGLKYRQKFFVPIY